MTVTRAAVARAYKDAARWLASNRDPADYECCGIPLTEQGTCYNRDYHPTPFSVAITSYPEQYTEKGTLIR